MYSIMSGDYKEDKHSVHRTGSPTENSIVTNGLTIEQAIAITDELNGLSLVTVIDKLRKANERKSNVDSYIDDMIDNGFAVSHPLPEEKINPAKELALKLTSYFRNNGQLK